MEDVTSTEAAPEQKQPVYNRRLEGEGLRRGRDRIEAALERAFPTDAELRRRLDDTDWVCRAVTQGYPSPRHGVMAWFDGMLVRDEVSGEYLLEFGGLDADGNMQPMYLPIKTGVPLLLSDESPHLALLHAKRTGFPVTPRERERESKRVALNEAKERLGRWQARPRVVRIVLGLAVRWPQYAAFLLDVARSLMSEPAEAKGLPEGDADLLLDAPAPAVRQ